MTIDWESSDSLVLCNPAYSLQEQRLFHSLLVTGKHFSGHVWLSTSGSSSRKWVGLSKSALITSAEAVNHHLKSDSQDCWINPLPLFHVGGLGIWARAYLSGANVYDFKSIYSKWNPETFYSVVVQEKGSLTSLVPAQLHDLVTLGLKAPSTLRVVVIGGGALLPSLYDEAIKLGWPILPSYGLTECATQVATASLDSINKNTFPQLKILPHLQVKQKEGNERFLFSGKSLLTTYAFFENDDVSFVDPKIDGWLSSEDYGVVEGDFLNIYGRLDQIIKIGGENVDLARLEMLLQHLRLKMKISAEMTLFAVNNSRLGNVLHLATESKSQDEISILVEQFQKNVLPYEKIRQIHYYPEGLPKSSLGKILRKELSQIVDKRTR